MVPPAEAAAYPPALPDGPDWRPRERAVLLFLFRGNEVLLMRKKRGLGAGKINAPGGRIDPGETPEQAAVRETREEVGLSARGIREAGQLFFQFADGHSIHCTVFTGREWEGALVETDEADPFWVARDAVPFDQMWADDRHWFPALLRGAPFRGYFTFEGDVMGAFRVDEAADGVSPP